jgi:hypothetical protein
VNSAQLTVLSEPLKAPSLGLVVARENEWHGRYFIPNIADLSLFWLYTHHIVANIHTNGTQAVRLSPKYTELIQFVAILNVDRRRSVVARTSAGSLSRANARFNKGEIPRANAVSRIRSTT